jgi:hypothetical protein
MMRKGVIKRSRMTFRIGHLHVALLSRLVKMHIRSVVGLDTGVFSKYAPPVTGCAHRLHGRADKVMPRQKTSPDIAGATDMELTAADWKRQCQVSN